MAQLLLYRGFMMAVPRSLRIPFVPLLATQLALLVACSGGPVDGRSDSGTSARSGTSTSGSDSQSEAPSSRVVFVTRSRFPGNKLGGRAGADDKCRTFAAAAGLAGNFQAWISTDTEDAIDNVPEGGPWHTVGRTDVAFANRAAWGGYPRASVAYDELGSFTNALIWTGTALGGSRDDACGNWDDDRSLGVVGNGRDGDSEWTEGGKQQCFYSASLLCYQTD